MGWIRALFHRRKLQEELDDEMRLHADLQVEEYLKAGLSPAEARAASQRRFGNAASVRERCRDENGITRVETFRQDLRFGARTLIAQRGFSATVLLTLALGIGANTAMFSVLRGILFEPLPLPDPDRVVIVWENDRLRGTTRENASYPDYLDMRQQSKLFDYLAASQSMDVTLSGRGEAERVPAARVTFSYFGVLGLEPVIGRVFGPGEDGIVLSHALWQRKFGGAASVLGSTVYLDGFSGTILGVLPPEAVLDRDSAELWSSVENVRATQFRGMHNTHVLGRLRRGASVEQAQAEMAGIMSRLEQEYPKDNQGRGALVVPLHEDLAGSMRPALKVLAAAVAGVLLIACVNIASLLLARASSRSREMAVRMSLGAGRARLTRQLLTESLLLALAGGFLGVAVAYGGAQALIAFAPAGTPLLGRVRVDGLAIAATLGFSLAAWLIFGLLPAVRTSAAAPASALKAAGRTTAGREPHRHLHGLVLAEIALAVVLVISAGLLIRSFWRLRQVDLGYRPSGVVSLRVKLPETRYPWPKFPFREWPAVTGFHDRLKNTVTALPGVESASLALASPARKIWTTRTYVEGRPVPPDGEQKEAQYRTADPGYLKVTGARLVRGRFFDKANDERHPMVAVLNEAFVREHFPGEDPIGRRIVVFGTPREVVGIVYDIRYSGPGSPASPTMYFPVRQQPWPDCTLMVRTSGDPAALAPALRRAVAAADAAVAPFDAMTLDAAIAGSTARERFVLSLLTGFGALALALAIVGIYGVVSYVVGGRRREIALRIAMGAGPRDIFTQVAGGTVRLAVVGVAAGLAFAAAIAPLMQPLVFETSTRDTTTYSAVAGMLLVVAFCGAALPARRAMRLDPAITLREE
jgi:putative ABC transport system permease protein